MAEVLHALLSNAIVALGLAVVGFLAWRLTRRAPLARGIWLLALLRLVTPPVFDVETSWLPSLASAPAEPTLVATSPAGIGVAPSGSTVPHVQGAVPAPSPTTRDAPWPVVPRLAWALFLVWTIGAGAAVVLGFLRVRRCRALVARATPASAEVTAVVRQLAVRLGLRRVPDVRQVDAHLSPFLWAFGARPTVVLPVAMMRALQDDEREAVLAHELAHLARRDHLVRWLELVVLAVHWWNPVARWTCSRLQEVEELCCDARAVAALPSTPRNYGRAILVAAEFLATPESRKLVPYGATGLGGAHLLKRRLSMIVTHKLQHRLGWPVRLVMVALTVAMLPWGLQAQEEKKKPKPKTKVVILDPDGKTTVVTGDKVEITGRGRVIGSDGGLVLEADSISIKGAKGVLGGVVLDDVTGRLKAPVGRILDLKGDTVLSGRVLVNPVDGTRKSGDTILLRSDDGTLTGRIVGRNDVLGLGGTDSGVIRGAVDPALVKPRINKKPTVEEIRKEIQSLKKRIRELERYLGDAGGGAR